MLRRLAADMPFADADAPCLAALEQLAEASSSFSASRTRAPAPRPGLFGRRAAAWGLALRAGPADRPTSFGGVRRRHLARRHLGDERRTIGSCGPRLAHRRGEPGPYGTVTPNFELYVDLAAIPALAILLVASLQLLAVEPRHLSWSPAPRGPLHPPAELLLAVVEERAPLSACPEEGAQRPSRRVSKRSSRIPSHRWLSLSKPLPVTGREFAKAWSLSASVQGRSLAPWPLRRLTVASLDRGGYGLGRSVVGDE